MAHRRSTCDVDRALGQLLRERREVLGISQRHLGERLGISYQQIQKYERGCDRISASRLAEICRALDIDVGYVYGESVPGARPRSAAPAPATVSATEVDSLLAAYRRIASPGVRRLVMTLVVMIAQHKPGVGPAWARARD
jgi:transcriptional regulator with XRE-family HTH domain